MLQIFIFTPIMVANWHCGRYQPDAGKRITGGARGRPAAVKTTLLNLIAELYHQHGSIQPRVSVLRAGSRARRGLHQAVATVAQCPGQRGVRPATGRYREMQRLETCTRCAARLEGNRKTLHLAARVNVGGWVLLARWRQIPSAVITDEPFGALDAFTRDQMQTLLLKLWQETGKQVLLITHDIEEAVLYD